MRAGILSDQERPTFASASLRAYSIIVDDNHPSCGKGDTADESCAVGDTGMPANLVPRALVRAAMSSETAYDMEPAESMVKLLNRLQHEDKLFVIWHSEEYRQRSGKPLHQ